MKTKNRSIRRLWHHYKDWEDYQNGMWRSVYGEERKALLAKAIKFTGNAELYGSYMARVIQEWPVGCEHNLTDTGSNRKAWIGHAACCLAIGCPEDITREAWGHLTTQQQDEANLQAQKYIEIWEANHEAKNSGVHSEVGAARVS